MTDDKLNWTIRWVAEQIANGGPDAASAAVDSLRPYCSPETYKGKKPDDFTRRDTLEWYGWSVIDIVDTGSWFAMNSWLNCVDKFAPA